jgi:hypothetical protein
LFSLFLLHLSSLPHLFTFLFFSSSLSFPISSPFFLSLLVYLCFVQNWEEGRKKWKQENITKMKRKENKSTQKKKKNLKKSVDWILIEFFPLIHATKKNTWFQ